MHRNLQGKKKVGTMKCCRKTKYMKKIHVFFDFIAARLGHLARPTSNRCRSGANKHKLCKCWTLINRR